MILLHLDSSLNEGRSNVAYIYLLIVDTCLRIVSQLSQSCPKQSVATQGLMIVLHKAHRRMCFWKMRLRQYPSYLPISKVLRLM